MTQTSKHTPGPWRLRKGQIHYHDDEYDGGGYSILMGEYDEGGGISIHCLTYAEDCCKGDKRFDEMVANTRLIAAAPELLEAATLALKALQITGYESSGHGDALTAVRAAIAKATRGKE